MTMTDQTLLFSIVIPTYARPQKLAQCLNAIAHLNYPRDRFEVIIVDDGSPTSLEPVVQPFREQFNLTLMTQSNAGPANARNTGVTLAKGKYIVFTDDDCEPDVNWLQVFADGFSKKPDCMLGGYTINKLSDNIFSQTSQLLIDYIYSYYNSEDKEASFFASNNFALSKEQFLHIGSFDTTFPLAAGEDREFCDRWLYHGYKMQYLPDAIILHSHYLTWSSFCKQHLNYGRGAFHYHQLRSQRQQEKMKVEPLHFYWDLLTFPWGKFNSFQSISMSVLLLISQVYNVIGFFKEKQLNSPQTLAKVQIDT
jgi:glycosyltransferase involved in cell wall biosynthesis